MKYKIKADEHCTLKYIYIMYIFKIIKIYLIKIYIYLYMKHAHYNLLFK